MDHRGLEGAPGRGAVVANHKTGAAADKTRRPVFDQMTAMSHRILLVENDELLGVLLELALGEAGYGVARARSGMEALSRLTPKAPPVDLVITDIGLGKGPDGWQVARRARARAPDLPVIYMTGGRADQWRPQHVPLGVLLLKPFPIAQLVEMAGHLLEGRVAARGTLRLA
jgi:DNA-binding response OmpR family regulator